MLLSRYCRSQSCLNSLKRFSIGNRPKFIEPMLSEATSGLKVARRADALLDRHVGRAAGGEVDHAVGALLDDAAGTARTPRASGRAGRSRDRARAGGRWRRPASAAPIAASAISSGVTGRCGDIEGVWIAPVTAQVMMTLRVSAMLLSDLAGLAVRACARAAPSAGGRASAGARAAGPAAAAGATLPLDLRDHRAGSSRRGAASAANRRS